MTRGEWGPTVQTLRREQCHVRSFTLEACLFLGMRCSGCCSALRGTPEIPAKGDGRVSQQMLTISETSVHIYAMMGERQRSRGWE
jgi:hypothetical protein